MTTDARAEIKARLDILDVIGGHVSLHRSGTQHVGLCPFHAEKTPSFSVSQQRQAWYCHGCHEGGDIFTFVEKIEGVDFPRALELLAERAGVELEKDRRGGARGAGRRRSIELNERAAKFYEYVLWNLAAGGAGRRLLAERGVDEALARRFRVGFAPQGGQAGDALSRYLVGRGGAALSEVAAAGLAGRGGRDLFRHRLVFPISDERGQVLGFGGRALGDATPKYLNTPETGAYHKSMALFGLDQARQALRERRVAVVVEGYFDVLAAHAAGVANVVASSGTALTREQVRIVARHADLLVLCFDGDAAGRRAADSAVDLCAAERLAARIAVMPPEFKDPDEMVRADPAAFAATISGAEPEWHVLLLWATAGTGGGVDERRRAGERVAALLRRIPDENTRELYAREGAQRLEVSASSLVASALTEVRAANLTRGRSTGERVTAPLGVGSPSPAVEADSGDPGLADDDPGNPPPSWEEFLAAYAAQRPALARLVVDEMGLDLDDLASPAVRRILELARSAPPGSGLPLHALGAADRRLAARLSVRDLPELATDADPVALERAMADCVRQVRRAASRGRARREIGELLAASGGLDPERDENVAARLRRLLEEERESPE
ncbi:MAG: DNA primase [Candidatus Dormiibacterota bacterium]